MGWRDPETAMTQCKTRGGQLQSGARHLKLIRAGERNQLFHLRLPRSLIVCFNKYVLPEMDPSLGYTGSGCVYFILCVCLLPTCMHMHHMDAWDPGRQEEAIGFPGTGVMVGCKPPYRCRTTGFGSLQE